MIYDVMLKTRFLLLVIMSSKKQQLTREQYEQRVKAEREAHLREATEYKTRIRPLVNFLRKNKLRFEHAHVAEERVEYFRIDEFDKIVEGNREKIETDEVLNELVKGVNSELIFFRRPDHIKLKYPKSLEPVLVTHPQRKFASFRFDTTESRHWLTILAIVGVLLLVLFPIWPFELKYCIWWVCLILLVAIVAVLVVRLAVYLLVVIFDYHVWIFPNFLNSTGFWDSFLPVVEVAKGDKSWLNVFIRLFALSSFLLLVFHVYLNPTFIDEQISFTKDTFQDLHDWGVGKIKNEGNFSQRALTNLDHILNETADAHGESIILDEPVQLEGEEVIEEVITMHEGGLEEEERPQTEF